LPRHMAYFWPVCVRCRARSSSAIRPLDLHTSPQPSFSSVAGHCRHWQAPWWWRERGKGRCLVTGYAFGGGRRGAKIRRGRQPCRPRGCGRGHERQEAWGGHGHLQAWVGPSARRCWRCGRWPGVLALAAAATALACVRLELGTRAVKCFLRPLCVPHPESSAASFSASSVRFEAWAAVSSCPINVLWSPLRSACHVPPLPQTPPLTQTSPAPSSGRAWTRRWRRCGDWLSRLAAVGRAAAWFSSQRRCGACACKQGPQCKDQRALLLPSQHSPLQKELALAINEKPTVIGEYESGRAIPNPSILSKLDRALGVHLPRPPKKK